MPAEHGQCRALRRQASDKPCMGLSHVKGWMWMPSSFCFNLSVPAARPRAAADRPPRVRRQRPVDGLRLGESADRQRTERSPPLGAIPRAATLYSAGSAGDPDHEAVIRFSSRAPRRRRRCSSNQVRSPARIGTARSCRTVRRNSADCPLAPPRPEPAPKIESPPIAFVIDIETTGLRPHDRTVALAAIRLIGLKMPPDGHYYLVFDPRKDNHPEAEASMAGMTGPCASKASSPPSPWSLGGSAAAKACTRVKAKRNRRSPEKD
jgi:hypothetical protein